jgi:uncharacterized protein YbgA (DUF1722 family)
VSKNQEITNVITLSEKEVNEYVFERFNDIKKRKIKDLVTFQAMNKYMLMAHSQDELKKLGNVVASYKKNSFDEIITEYEKHLKIALEKIPTTKTHTNVILHIFGYFSKNFNQTEKEQFFKLLDEFREEKISIGKILSQINPIIYRFNSTYLASQTYFLLYADPQPGNLFQMLSK